MVGFFESILYPEHEELIDKYKEREKFLFARYELALSTIAYNYDAQQAALEHYIKNGLYDDGVNVFSYQVDDHWKDIREYIQYRCQQNIWDDFIVLEDLVCDKYLEIFKKTEDIRLDFLKSYCKESSLCKQYKGRKLMRNKYSVSFFDLKAWKGGGGR